MSVALVTGGGRGLGREIALALGAAGHAVVVVGRNRGDLDGVVEEIRAGADAAGSGGAGAAGSGEAGSGGEAMAFCADVTDANEAEAAIKATVSGLGPVDLLVCNAGSMASGPLWEIEPSHWWRDFETSVLGSYNFIRPLVPAMLERGSGRIICLSSRMSTVGDAWSSSYTSAKAAVTRLVECLHAETYAQGLRTFALSPGVVHTDMTEELQRAHWIGDALRAMEPDDWAPPELAAEATVAIAAGEADRLSGRFIDSTLGIPAQLDRLGEDTDDRVWRLRLIE